MATESVSIDTPHAEDAMALLRRTRVDVHHATFALVGLSHEDWSRLLQDSGLSPRPEAVFMMLRDEREVTMLLEDSDWSIMRHAAPAARVETNFRLVTLDIQLGWDTIGYLALVTSILAAARIPVGALSAHSRDHLLIKQDDLARALRALGPHVAELC